jgi:hypothetical protein
MRDIRRKDPAQKNSVSRQLHRVGHGFPRGVYFRRHLNREI